MELGIRNPVLDPVLANKIKIGSGIRKKSTNPDLVPVQFLFNGVWN
jgi:hypothetical protein